MNAPTPSAAPVRRPSTLKLLFWLLLVPAVLIALYFTFVLNWNYSTGERAGWVQKFSRKGWLCKTWEGEMAMVTMPGAIPEKFLFTVWDAQVAASINKVMGKRVTLHYEEKVGLPTTCFGDSRHFVTGVVQVEEIPLTPGIVVPTPRPSPDEAAPASTPPPSPAAPAPTQAPAPSPTPAPAPAPGSTAPPSTPPPSGY
jgi:hypothetical protein